MSTSKNNETKRKEFEEYQKRKQSENANRKAKNKTALNAFEEYQSNRIKSEMAGWQKKAHTLIDSLYNDSQKRGESYQDSLAFSHYYNDNDSKIAELLKEGDLYGQYFGKQGGRYNDYNDAYKETVKYLTDWQSALAKENAHWSQWASEEEYNAAAEMPNTPDWSTYDIDSARADLEQKQATYDKYYTDVDSWRATVNDSKIRLADIERQINRSFGLTSQQRTELENEAKVLRSKISAGEEYVSSFPFDFSAAKSDIDKLTKEIDSAQAWRDQKAREDETNRLYEEIVASPDYEEILQKHESDSFYEGSIGNLLKKTYGAIFNPQNAGNRITAANATIEYDPKTITSYNSGAKNKILPKFMNEKEQLVYNAYYYRGEYDKAEEYYKSIEGDLEERARSVANTNAAQFAKDKPFWSSAQSVGHSVFGTPTEAAVDLIKYGIDAVKDPTTAKLDRNDMADTVNITRQTVSEDMTPVGRFFYNTTMSGLDSLLSGLAFGNVAGVTLALSTGSSAYNEGIDRGMSGEQAMAYGIASGLFEGIFESLSLGNLNALKEISPKTFKDVAVNIAKSIGVNASEETFTEIANIAYDTLLNGEYSDYQEMIDAGMSKEEALKQFVLRVLEAGASGALMGFGFGGVGSAIGYVNNKGADTVADIQNQMRQSASENQMYISFQNKVKDSKVSTALTDIVKGREVKDGDLQKVIGNEAARSILNETLGTDIKAENSLDEARGIISKAFESSEAKTPAETKIDRNKVIKSLEVNLPSEKAESFATIIADIGNGKEVSDKQIASVLNNKYARNALNKYLGRTVDNKFTESSKASDVRAAMAEGDYSRQGQAVLFGSTLGMSGNAIKGLSAVVANSHADVASIAHAYNVVYKAAKSGKALADVSGVEALSPTQKLIAYEYGVMDGLVEQSESKKKATVEAEEAETTLLDADKTAEAQKKIDNAEKSQSRKEGKVIYEGDRTKLSSLQKRSLHALDSISKALGVTFHIFESQEVDGKRVAKVNGKETSANGWYDTKTGEIWIDINAGVNGDGLIIWTASHELTHFIKQWSPEKFKVFADFLLENYAERGISKDALIDRQIAKAKKNGREISRDEALEEVIADSCETFLLDSNAAEKIIELRNKDKSLAQKILDFLRKALRDIKAMLKGVQPDSYEGKLVSEMTGTLQQLHDLWADALADASEAYSTVGGEIDLDSNVKYSVREIVGDSGTNYGVGVYLDSTLLTELTEDERIEMVKEYVKELGGSVFTAYDGNGDAVDVHIVESTKKYKNAQGKRVPVNRHLTNYVKNQTKQEAIALVDELIVTATQRLPEPAHHPHDWLDNNGTNDWDVWTTYLQDKENTVWEATLQIANSASGEKILYEIHPIIMVEGAAKDSTSSTTPIITQPDGVVNTETEKNSLRDPDALTNREILANMLDSVAESDRDKAFLDKYKARLEQIEKDKAEIARLKEEKKGAAKLRREVITSKIEKLDKGITESEKWLKNLEETATLKRLVSKEREAMYAEGVLAGQMAQGKADAKVIRKQQEKLDKEKQKRADMLAEYRARVAEREQRIKEKYQEARERSIEGRNKTDVRKKIKRVVATLHRLLTSDSKEKHVPSGLTKVVADALSIINMDTVGAEKRIKEYDERIAKATDPIVKESLINTRNEIEAQGVRFAEKIAKLQDAYAQIKKDASADVRSVYSEDIEEYIKAVREQVGDTSIKDMDIDQLEAVYEMFTIILKNVRDGNKLFLEGRGQTVAENSMAVDLELSQNGKSNKLVSKNGKLLKKFSWSLLKPVTFMKTLGSKTFTKLYENIRKGEDTWAVDVNEAKNFFSEMRDKYKFDSWDFEKKYDFADDVGNKFSLTVEQIMSLYAYSKRDKADLHLEKGGFVFDSSITVKKNNKLGIVTEYYVNDATPYRLSKETVKGIASKLSKDMTDFVDEMQAYLSDVMGEKGNEISMKMYDIRLFKEKNYFPLKTSQYFREFDPEKGATPKIKNSGFTHKTMPGANNPIILSNFMDVWTNHVNDMSMYHAFTLPIEDFMRVYNYNSRADGFNAIKQKISQYYGDEANKYIQTLIDQLNNGARSDPDASLVSRGIAAFKKAKTFVSASVVIQQPSALARAWAYIDPKYFVDKPKATLHDKTWAELKKHAPVAIIKEMGRFDSNMGRSTADYIMKRDYKTIKEKATGIFTDKEYRDDVLSKAPALADELAWCAIWKAVKREVAATTNLEVNSAEYFERCGERFTEIIENTQVYDSVLSKSEIMRSKDSGLKMVTAFAAEPITTLNMMVDAIVEGKRGRKSFARRLVGAVAASIVLNSILVSTVYAARDDDEDETYAEKYLASLTAELVDGFNPLTYVPLVRDIWSVMQGYDIARTDMSMIGDIWNSVEGLFSTSKSGFDKVSDLVGNIAALLGVPADNIMRDAKAIYNVGELIYNKNVNDLSTTKWGVRDAVMEALKNVTPLWSKIESYTGNKRTKYDEIYEAMMSGDETYIKRAQSHFTEDNLESGIKRGLKDNDVRIEEAARAYLKGDVRRFGEIIDTIAAEGVFDAELIESVVRSEINKLKPDTVTEETVEAATSIYKTSDINIAFDSGDIDTALDILAELIEVKSVNNEEKIRKEAEEKGKTLSTLEILASAEYDARSSIRSSITSYWKPLYVEASKAGNQDEMDRIYDILLKTELYGNWRDLEKTLKDWRK